MRTFGLIGYPLSHSFSKRYFSEKFEQEGISGHQYELFPLEHIDLLETILNDKDLKGLNVTIPYKVAVLPFLDELDSAAAYIGAVNCIAVNQQGGKPFLKGYNTDAYGFEASLTPLLKTHHQKALIFGNGGAAKAVKYVLEQLGISYLSVVRNTDGEHMLYEQVDEMLLQDYTLLINTTPLGMSPNVEDCPPIPYEYISDQHLAYDLVYNPLETKFLTKCKERGAMVKNGLEMLHLQAERSWEIWNNKK